MFHEIDKTSKQQIHIKLLWGEGGIVKSKCIYSLQNFHKYNISFKFKIFHKLYLECQFSIQTYLQILNSTSYAKILVHKYL
jgi:hypothetical protein